MAQLLLEFGADASLTDDSGQTPAALAQTLGNEIVLKDLIPG
jgi:ankyrin repeat protein